MHTNLMYPQASNPYRRGKQQQHLLKTGSSECMMSDFLSLPKNTDKISKNLLFFLYKNVSKHLIRMDNIFFDNFEKILIF